MFMRSNILVLKNILMLINYPTRYLGLPTPDDNLAGYQRSDVTAKVTNSDPLVTRTICKLALFQARKLSNKKYLMVHGTADDNVHYQQSMMLARAMEEADVLFR